LTDGTLPFSSTEYDKLDYDVFPTIRRRDKYGRVGDVNEVKAGERGNRRLLGTAEIIAKETVTINSLNSELFKFDTDTNTVAQAQELVNQFYTDPIGKTESLTLYWSRWIDKENQTLTEWSE